jgi:hypothetical protein
MNKRTEGQKTNKQTKEVSKYRKTIEETITTGIQINCGTL